MPVERVKLTVRVAPETYAAMRDWAAQAGVSMNSAIEATFAILAETWIADGASERLQTLTEDIAERARSIDGARRFRGGRPPA